MRSSRQLNQDLIDKVNKNTLTPSHLGDVIDGSEYITVDESESGDKLKISFDVLTAPVVVKLTTLNGTLTDAQYAILSSNTNAKIVYETETAKEVFSFSSLDATNVVYKQDADNYVTITKASKTYVITIAE